MAANANKSPNNDTTTNSNGENNGEGVGGEGGEDLKFHGNDEFYLKKLGNGNGNGTAAPFQIRVTISRANEALASKKYHDALFAVGKNIYGANDDDDDDDDDENNNGGGDKKTTVGEFAQDHEQVKELKKKVQLYQQQKYPSHRENGANCNNNSEGGGNDNHEYPLGYLVEMMLLEPHVQPDEIVVAPPFVLDKSNPSSRAAILPPGTVSPYTTKNGAVGLIDNNANHHGRESVFDQDIFSSPQFVKPGPWERANIKAFDDIALDVRKALVRVEFPVFPEGCQGKTFREVYQLNARVSVLLSLFLL